MGVSIKTVLTYFKEHKTGFLTFLIYAYGAFISYNHGPISKFVTKKRHIFNGVHEIRDFSVELSLIALFFLLLYVTWRFQKGKRRLETLFYFFLFSLLMVFIYSVLSLHPVEFVHFLHYASLSFLLALVWDKNRERFLLAKIMVALFPVAFLDEAAYQYFINVHQKYMDFGDAYFNFVGVILGLLLYYCFSEPKKEYETKKPIYLTLSFKIYFVTVFIVTVLFAVGIFQITPPRVLPAPYLIDSQHFVIYMERIPLKVGHWNKHFIHGYYYALTPLQFLLITLFTGILFSTYDPRYRQRLKELFKIKKAEMNPPS